MCAIESPQAAIFISIRIELAEGGIVNVRNQSWRKRDTRECIKKI